MCVVRFIPKYFLFLELSWYFKKSLVFLVQALFFLNNYFMDRKVSLVPKIMYTLIFLLKELGKL